MRHDEEEDEESEDEECECSARPDWLHALMGLGFFLGYVLRLIWRAALLVGGLLVGVFMVLGVALAAIAGRR